MSLAVLRQARHGESHTRKINSVLSSSKDGPWRDVRSRPAPNTGELLNRHTS